jgi:hypothetical protein
MSLKIKALGLGLIAALALSAVAVLSASAETGGHYLTEEEHAILKVSEGEEEGVKHKQELVFPPIGPIHCPKVSYGATTTQFTVTEITITPTYEECTVTKTNEPVDITMNGCAYLFTVRKVRPQERHNTVDIECPTGKKIVIHVTNVCTIEVGPQTLKQGAVYRTRGSGKTHELTVENTGRVFYTRESGLCALLGTTPEEEGEMAGSFTLKAFNTVGEQIGLTATGTE